MMPSVVNVARIGLRRSARIAVCVVRMMSNIGIMCYQYNSDTIIFIEMLKHPQDFLAGMRIQIACRFIGKKNRRPVYQRPCNRHSLLLAAGKL
jgi:hypothetical protein